MEHPGQLVLLRSIGCEFGQGYLFARPMQPAAAQRLSEFAVRRV
jgi:EAL domain-containing protein (putative c-di-GMP-specific phosphodiesterase class I)